MSNKISKKVIAVIIVGLMIATSFVQIDFLNDDGNPKIPSEYFLSDELPIDPEPKVWDFNIKQLSDDLYYAESGSFEIFFNERASADGILIVRDGTSFSFKPKLVVFGGMTLGFNEVRSISGNEIVFLCPGMPVILKYVVGPTELKELLIIEGPINLPPDLGSIVLRAYFDLPEGYTISDSELRTIRTETITDEDLNIIDETGDPVFSLPAPVMIDDVVPKAQHSSRQTNLLQYIPSAIQYDDLKFRTAPIGSSGSYDVDVIMPAFLFELEAAQYPIIIDPTITGTETYSDGIYEITSNLLIENGGTLNLVNIKLRMHSDSSTTLKIWVKNGGTLNSEYTTICPNDEAYPYEFVIDGDVVVDDTDISFVTQYISVSSTGYMKADSSKIHDNVGKGVNVASGGELEYTVVEIYDCGGDGLYSASSNIDLYSTYVHDCTGSGFVLDALTDGILDSCTSESNMADGFKITSSSGIDLTDLLAEKNNRNFMITSSTLTFERSGSSEATNEGIFSTSSTLTLIDCFSEVSGTYDIKVSVSDTVTSKNSFFNEDNVQVQGTGQLVV
ncbi:MAG: hypothetical protein GQ558_04365, partial [Thermoplasmata archaeon]|nr:hypothetical protein [Thermoplasmata archaeon]